MKRIVSVLLTVLLSIGLAASALAMTVQPAPDLTALTPVYDEQQPLKIMFEGLYKVEREQKDGSVRYLYQYLPATLKYRQPLVCIAMPSGANAETFLEESNWLQVADEFGITIVLAEAGPDGWTADESMYMANVANYLDKRIYYISHDAAYYLVGYGDAASVVMNEAVENADVYAGAAVFGLDGYDTAILDKMAEEESAKAGVTKNHVALPVWLGASERTEAFDKLVNYWVEANECWPEAMTSTWAEEVYQYPAYLANTNEITYAHPANVMVTLGDRDVTAADFVYNLYANFLRRVRRQDSGDIGALRWYASNEEMGMDYCTVEVNGVAREFYVYVPTAYRGTTDVELPVFYAFHGGGGSGEEFGTRTAWYKVAEEKGFICVFPTGSRRYVSIQANSFTPRSGWEDADADFFKASYDYMLANYPVDKSRVYTSGQSQGSGMSQIIAAKYPELLAAATCCSVVTDFRTIEVKEDVVLPMMWSVGTKDKYSPYSEEADARIEDYMTYWTARYNMSEDCESKYVAGDNSIRDYATDKGVALLRFQWVNEKVHANIPDECYDFYNFAIQFSRGEDGTLYYKNKPVVIE